MIKVEHGVVEMSGNPVDLMADVVTAVAACRAGVIDDIDDISVKEFTMKLFRESIEKAMTGGFEADLAMEKETDPAKALEAAEELNRFFDRLEARKKGWRKA